MGLLTRITGGTLAGPVATGLAGLLAMFFMNSGSNSRLVVDENALGPTSWPRVMILGIIVTSVIWGIARVVSADRAVSGDRESDKIDPAKLAIGIAAVIGYGTAMVYIGFAFATFLFLFVWLLLGEMRNLFAILATSLFGTLAMLYLFLKVAYLPLPRGQGWMDTLTVGLYQFLGIF